MDRVQKSSNSYHALMRREVGLTGRFLPWSLFAQRCFTNLANNRCRQVTYESQQTEIFSLRFQYPYAITLGSDKTMKLWHLDTGELQWSSSMPVFNSEDIDQLELSEDRIICLGKFIWSREPAYSGFMVKIFNRLTGKEMGSYTHHTHLFLARSACLIGKQRDFFIVGSKQIERCNLDGEVIEKIEIEARYISSLDVISVKGFLAIFNSDDPNVLVVHDLNKKEKFQIRFRAKTKESTPTVGVSEGLVSARFAFHQSIQRRQIEAFSFDGVNLFCATKSQFSLEEEGHLCDYHVFDFEKKIAVPLYKKAEDNPLFKKAIEPYILSALHKERVYLGYSSGHVIAVNWATQTHIELVHHQGPIAHLSVQEGVLVIGAEETLFFWDSYSLTKMGQTNWSSPFRSPVVHLGKLLFADSASLVVRDYSVRQEEEHYHG